MDSEGQKVENTIGPFEEFTDIQLVCEAEGGKRFVFKIQLILLIFLHSKNCVRLFARKSGSNFAMVFWHDPVGFEFGGSKSLCPQSTAAAQYHSHLFECDIYLHRIDRSG